MAFGGERGPGLARYQLQGCLAAELPVHRIPAGWTPNHCRPVADLDILERASSQHAQKEPVDECRSIVGGGEPA